MFDIFIMIDKSRFRNFSHFFFKKFYFQEAVVFNFSMGFIGAVLMIFMTTMIVVGITNLYFA